MATALDLIYTKHYTGRSLARALTKVCGLIGWVVITRFTDDLTGCDEDNVPRLLL